MVLGLACEAKTAWCLSTRSWTYAYCLLHLSNSLLFFSLLACQDLCRWFVIYLYVSEGMDMLLLLEHRVWLSEQHDDEWVSFLWMSRNLFPVRLCPEVLLLLHLLFLRISKAAGLITLIPHLRGSSCFAAGSLLLERQRMLHELLWPCYVEDRLIPQHANPNRVRP